MASEYLRVAKARVDQTHVTGKTHHYRDGKVQPPPETLEIVQLPRDSGYYLVYLDEKGAEMNDTWHESLDRAMDQANYEFGLSIDEWERTEVTWTKPQEAPLRRRRDRSGIEAPGLGHSWPGRCRVTMIRARTHEAMEHACGIDRSQLFSDEGPIGSVAAEPRPEAALAVAAWLLRWNWAERRRTLPRVARPFGFRGGVGVLSLRRALGIVSIAMLSVTGLALDQATATETYPVPYKNTPDWRGFGSNPPKNEAGVMRSRVLGHLVVLVIINSTKPLDPHAAAHLAYRNLLNNVRLPKGALYVVFIIYGPANFIGAHAEYAYVFARDSEDHWRPRLVSEKELVAIECAIGRCPNL
jgi:hypothetical protein